MNPIAFASFHSAPLEASRAIALIAGVALGSAGCTMTSDEFTPTTYEPDGDAALTETDEASVDPGADAAEADTHPALMPNPGVAGVDEAGPSGGVPLTNGTATPDAADAEGAPATALDVDVLPVEGGPEGEGESAPAIVLPALSLLTGWADVAGLGVQTTSGGGDRAPVVARTAAELVALAASSEPMTIAVEGTIEVPALALTSNKTLIGIGSDATVRGGIAIRGTPDAFVQNVIVANLNIAAETSSVDGDGIQIQYAHHVWVDHCALRDAADGLLDVVHGSDFVTVSHSRFVYTAASPDPTHRFAVLVGHDITNGSEDRGHLNVTWLRNFWGEGVTRALSARFASIHVFNNLFRSPGGEAVLSAGLESSWLVENNQFENVVAPHAILLGSAARLAATGNVYLQATGAREATATGFEPAYAYAIESPFELAASIEADAGPR